MFQETSKKRFSEGTLKRTSWVSQYMHNNINEFIASGEIQSPANIVKVGVVNKYHSSVKKFYRL